MQSFRVRPVQIFYTVILAALVLLNLTLYQHCALTAYDQKASVATVSLAPDRSKTSAGSESVNKELFEGVRRTWDFFGAEKPMFGVLTHDVYKDESNMTQEAIEEFWNSGQRSIDKIFQEHLPEQNISIGNKVAIDFGSGVGRLSIPLAGYFQRVYSIDISPNYLQVLMNNAKSFGVEERIVDTLNQGDVTTVVDEPNGVDFILSLIVIQHNPPPVQRVILKQLLSLLRPGGVAYLHIPYALGTEMKDRTEVMIKRSQTEEGTGKMQMHYTPEVLIKYIAEEEADCELVAVLQRTIMEIGLTHARFIIRKN